MFSLEKETNCLIFSWKLLGTNISKISSLNVKLNAFIYFKLLFQSWKKFCSCHSWLRGMKCIFQAHGSIYPLIYQATQISVNVLYWVVRVKFSERKTANLWLKSFMKSSKVFSVRYAICFLVWWFLDKIIGYDQHIVTGWLYDVPTPFQCTKVFLKLEQSNKMLSVIDVDEFDWMFSDYDSEW